MQTKLLEVTVVIDNKQYHVLNTEMEITATWDINFIKHKDCVNLEVNMDSLQGYFGWRTTYDNYSLTKKYDFKTDSSWKYNIITNAITFPLSPSYATIDFDKKEITINL